MAINKSNFKFSGKIGDLIFTKGKNRNTVKHKSDKPHQLSENSIKSGRDLAEASLYSKIVRMAFAEMVADYRDESIYYRLNSRFLETMKPLPQLSLGKKKVQDGDISILKGFRFDKEKSINSLLYYLPSVTIDNSGLLKINLQVWGERVAKKLDLATEMVLQISIFCHNFDDGTYEVVKLADLVRKELKSARVNLKFDVTGEVMILVAMGFHYLQDGYWIQDKNLNAAEITHAFRLKDGIEVPFIGEQKAPAQIPLQDDGIGWDYAE